MTKEGRCVQVLWGFVMPMSPLCIWKQHFLCNGSFAGVICRWNLVPLVWTPETHYAFPEQEKKRAICIMKLSLKKETKGSITSTHWHPESPFHQLHKDILFRILSYAITLHIEDIREQEAIQSYRSLVTFKMNNAPQLVELHNSEPEMQCTVIWSRSARQAPVSQPWKINL